MRCKKTDEQTLTDKIEPCYAQQATSTPEVGLQGGRAVLGLSSSQPEHVFKYCSDLGAPLFSFLHRRLHSH